MFTFWEIKFYAAGESVVVSFTLKSIMQAILAATHWLQNPICPITHSIIGNGMVTLCSSTAEIVSESAIHLSSVVVRRPSTFPKFVYSEKEQ